MILVGLAGLGGATWAVWERHEPESAPVVTTVAGMGGTPTALVEEETLQAKNVRLTRRDVVPLILPELQKFLPPDNDVKLVDVRAFGSKVECEFHAVKPVFGEPARLKIRYCVLRRWLELEADALGAGGFQRLSPDRPIFLELELPFLPRKELILGREQTDAVRRAFGRLPGDERAERESIAFWFGSPRPPEGRLFLPTGARAIAGNSRDLFFHAADEGLYVLRDGSWRYAGYCPGWLAEVDETRLYRIDKGWIHSRPIEPRNEPWAPLCPLPLLPPKQQPSVLSQMRAGPGLLFVSSHERVLWVRSLAEPDARWVSEPWPGGADAGLFAGVGKRLVAVRDWSLIVWPVGGRDWVPVGPIPFARPVVQTGVLGMTAWRGRVLVWPSGGGPIFARTLDPEAKWQVIGHFGPLEAHPLPTTPRNKHGGVEKGQ